MIGKYVNKASEAFNTLVKAYRKKGWYFCWQELNKKFLPLRFVTNENVMNLHCQYKAYEFLKKKYLPRLKRLEKGPAEYVENKTIWVCWLQGLENAPEIVAKCVDSIYRYAGDYKVVLITNDNLKDYVDIPAYVTEKLEKKRMQFAHYSDYIRVSLLEKYGGVWIDSTVLMTGTIPASILSLPFFCFRTSYLSDSCCVSSNWFISSHKGEEIVRRVKFLLDEYWRNEGFLCDYYLFHLIFALVVKVDSCGAEAWKKVPYYCNADAHTLQFELFDEYSEERFSLIREKSFMHKLTYKFDEGKASLPNTNYQHILNM